MNAWIPEVSKRQMEIYNGKTTLYIDWSKLPRGGSKTIKHPERWKTRRAKGKSGALIIEYVKEN